MNRWRIFLERYAPPLISGVLPAVLLSVGVARFIVNHFFYRAPFLLDSGWYSAIVYRAGVFPDNPQIACNYADWYYGIHVSPMVSAFSLLSYLAPVSRVEWYAFFEAVVYLPIGLATYAVASRLAPARALYRLPLTFAAAFAFTYSGQVIAMVSYPHYEAAIPGLLCVLVALVATGRLRLAWVMLVLAIAVREDAGIHAALALAPLGYLRLRGVAVPASLRTLIAMAAVAVGYSVVAIACQKLFFGSANLLRHEYLGSPLYGHITAELLADRVRFFVDNCQLLYYPFIATCLIAAVRRDARYLLGWAAGIPWFALNFFAVMEIKAQFGSYTVFPFVVGMFWVYVYGAHLAPPVRRMHPGVLEALFALVCASSALGLHRTGNYAPVVDDMKRVRTIDRDAVHGFVDMVARHRPRFGRFYVDYAVASLAIETLRPDESWHLGVRNVDAIMFHRFSVYRGDLALDLIANRLDTCVNINRTRLWVCTREPLPPDTFAGLATTTKPRDQVLNP